MGWGGRDGEAEWAFKTSLRQRWAGACLGMSQGWGWVTVHLWGPQVSVDPVCVDVIAVVGVAVERGQHNPAVLVGDDVGIPVLGTV